MYETEKNRHRALTKVKHLNLYLKIKTSLQLIVVLEQ